MAKSGYTDVKVTNWNTLRFSWSADTQSVPRNFTTVTWKLQLIATSDGYIGSTASKAWSVTINGQTFSGTNTIGISNNTTKTLASGTVSIAHKNDGSGSLAYTFFQEFAITFAGAQIGIISGTGTGTLDTIPRESSLTVSNGTLGTALTFTINRADSTFKHRIQYTCGDVSGYVAGSASTWTTATSISWTPPLSLAQQNTTGTSVSVKFTLGTYTSGGARVGGYPTKTITCAIPASVKPSCSLTLEDVNNIDDIYGSPVQGLSRIKITVNTTLAQGSPIASYSITADGKTYTTSPSTTPLLVTAGSSPITATVKDKRGRTGTASYTMNVQAYTKPAVSKLTVHRCNSDGTENDQGEYVKATFSASVTSLNSKNTATYQVRYKKITDSTWTTTTISAINNTYTVTNREYIFAADSNSSYNVELLVTDAHNTSTVSTTVSTAFTLMNFHQSGTGIRFGGVAEEENLFQSSLDAKFDKEVVTLGNQFTFSSPGTAGSAGYVRMARLTHKKANADTPITFVFTRRLCPQPMTVHVQFRTDSTTVDPDLKNITYEGDNYDAYLVHTATSIWDLYVAKVSAYDTITLQHWYSSGTVSDRLTVDFPGDLVSSVPTGLDGFYKATPAKLQSLLDYIYPVHSVYISYSHISPATLFGGTWERISNAFLWACDAEGTIGQTGGEKTHTLTVNELPSHSHGAVYSQHVSSTKNLAWYGESGSSMGYGLISTGGGQAHNNMPPYIQVSVWRRTA